jgi:hypothetical protein
MADKYLRYIPGTDEFETLDVSDTGTVRGRVKTDTADKMRKSGGYQLVGDEKWATVAGPTAAERQRAQVVERSGTGASGMVYAEQGGGPVLLPLQSAERQRLRIITADEARRLGEGVEAREQVVARSGTGAPGMVYVERNGEPILTRLEEAERQGLRVITADEARALGTALEERENAAQRPANSGPGIWGQIAQSVLGATPPTARTPEQVAQGVLATRPAPVQGNPAQDLVQSTGVGFAPAAVTTRGREFSGFRGDPAVVVRQPDGTSTPGGAHTTSFTASPARGGNVPPLEQPARSLTAADAAIPTPAAGGVQAASAAVRFAPAGASQGQRELADAFALQRQAVAERAALEEQKAAAEVARQDVEFQALRQRQQQEEERAALRQKATLDAEGRLADAVKALSEPSGEIDPSRWWNSRSTGQKIAAFASAFMTGFAGRPSAIQQFIDQDIAAQRFNLERTDKKRGQAVEGQKLLLGTMRERFQDEVLAEAAARQAALEQARKTAERETASFKGQDAQVRKQELLGALAQAEVEAKQAFQMRAGQLALQQAQFELEAQRFNQAQQQTQRGAVAESGQAVDFSTLTPEQKKRAVVLPGSQGRAVLALNEDSAKKAQEAVLTGGKILGLLDQAIAMRREYGSETFPSDSKETMTTLGKQILIAINKAEGLGSADADTTAILNEMIGGDLTAYRRLLPKLEQLRNTYQRNLGEAFTAYTGQPWGGVASLQTRSATR